MRTGGLALTTGIPIWQEFYKMFSPSTKRVHSQEMLKVTESGFAMMTQGMHSRFAEPTAESRYSFWLAFGTCPDA